MNKFFPSIVEVFQIACTFFLTCLAWVFFRSDSINIAFNYLAGIFNFSLFTIPEVLPILTCLLIFFLIVVEWINRENEHGLQMNNNSISQPFRWLVYYSLIFGIFIFGNFESNFEFIYFQF